MDALLFNTGDGGELNIDDNGVETTDGLETAAYLSLFCGEFWADSLQTDSEFKYPNRFWKLYQEIPVVPKNLSRFEDAAKKDLEELPVSSVTVSAQIIGLNKLKLTCQLDEDLFEFTENWDAMRDKIGADYSYKAPDPEYLTGLRVLIKDGVNIAPGGATWTSYTTTFGPGYEATFTNTSGEVVNSEDKYVTTQQFTIAIFYPFVAGVPSLNLEALLSAQKYWLLNGGITDRNIYTRNPTAYVNTNYDLSPTGYTFLALTIDNGTVKSYCNTNSSGVIQSTLAEIKSETLANQTDIDTLFQKVRCAQGSNVTVEKIAMWNTALTLETLQSWYDLGPTGDPL